jgi:hypothetical protein
MVVNWDRLSLLLLLFVNICIVSCSTSPNYTDFSNRGVNDNYGWIQEKDLFSRPLASITDIENYSDQSISFTLSRPRKVHIYAVGEALQSLADNQKNRFLKGDEIEIDLLRSSNLKSPKVSTVALMVAHDTSDNRFPGLVCKWSKTKYSYTAEIKIPLSMALGTGSLSNQFNIRVNDNDDTYIQKAQVGLFHCNQVKVPDSSNQKQETTNLDFLNKLHAGKLDIVVDGKIDEDWLKLSAIPIRENCYGRIRSGFDLAASVKFGYDEKNLYLLVHVLDASIIRLNEAEKKDKISFVDIGWLEDSHKKVLWKMDYLKAKWAGGAIKNQKTDTVLVLPAGNYTLRYKSDESHSLKRWDDEPPNTSFYGIVVYYR